MSLCQVLVNHISIRLYASQEISQKRFNRTATTAIIPVIVVEEISDILLFVHQSPNVLLIVMTQLGAITFNLYPHPQPSFIYIQYRLYFQRYVWQRGI